MADPVWGNLAKAQDDDETIEEAIARLIAVHETDPDAHTGAGESLETHKSQEVIDHPAGSVVDDKPKINKFSVQSSWESLDGWTQAGINFNYFGYMEINTTTVLNNIAYLTNPSDDQYNLTPDKTKSPIFETVAYVGGGGNREARIGMGDLDADEGVFFKYSSTKVYASYYDADNIEHDTELSGVSATGLHKLRIEIEWEVEIRWYIDNILAHTLDLTANEIALATSKMMKFWVKNLTAGQVGRIGSYRVLFQQNLL